MSVIIPDRVLQASWMLEAEMKQEISVMLFAMRRLTLAQAARFAEMDRIAFQHLIASRALYVNYDERRLRERTRHAPDAPVSSGVVTCA